MVECPICRTSNPSGSSVCPKCSTPIDIATIIIDPASSHTAPAGGDPEATMAAVADAGAEGWSVPIRKNAGPGAPLEPGAVLGDRYEIIKSLGEGGMGAVYEARDRELDRLVALKVIRPELAGHPEILRRFKQELILARQVTHKNVIRIFDLGMADGRKFITMDYIEGRDLKSILVERKKIPPAEAVHIMKQICRGLEAAHTEGVVHRDLKPQNIMVDSGGRVWVMDFGLARSMELAGMTRTGALMGTPDYMSPEQARAEKVDARSDLFSLGIIFYETITGVLPFQAETLMATLLKRVQEKAAPPCELDPAIPRRLSDIVMKCLEVDREKRYQTTGEMLADLTGDTPTIRASVSHLDAISLADIQPGAQFGPRYTIESVIGEGGMGKVYKAHDNDLDRTVALKLVRPELAGDPTSMQRFKQELLLASRISHRNILRIHDLGDVGGVKFISMAYIQGQDLHDVLVKSGRMPVARALNIAKQLAGALEAAHAEGVVHRDLKPRNVLIDETDHVYVSDFGLAKSLETESATLMTRAGEVLGTPRYMSPEQAESKPADHRSDLYSLGVILFEMVTGDAPFGGDSTLQVMYQHVTAKPKDPKALNPELPDYLGKVILRCLEKNPAERYQSASEVLRDLESGTPPTRVVRLRLAETAYPKWLIAAIIALPLLFGASLLIAPVREVVLGRLASGNKKQIYLAVLPFKVAGTDPNLKDAADGVVDSISAKLFQLKNVYVASAPAADAASKQGSPDKIAKSLGVKLLVRGTVQQGEGDKIGIVVTVDDTVGKRTLLNESFSGSSRDLLNIEERIYSRLLTSLELRPSSEEMTRSTTRLTSDGEAYQLYMRAQNLMHRQPDEKNVRAALDLYNRATLKDQSFALAYAGLADASRRMYTLTKDPLWQERSLGAAKQARDLNDNLPEVHFALGSVYSKTGNTAESIEELNRALQLAPNSDEGYRRLGFAYLSAGKKSEALDAYKKAVEVNPYYWLNYSHLGGAYFKFGLNDEALKAYQQVAKLAPDSEAGYTNIGAVYFREGKWNDAVAAFQKALEQKPSASLYSNLGTTYFYLGRYADAAKAFEKAVDLSADQQSVGNLADAYRWLGQKDKANATYDRAIGLAHKALQVNSRDVKTLEYLGLYYAKKGDASNARTFIRRAREIDPNDNELMYNEGLIHALADRKAEALKSLREAFQHGYSAEEAKNDPELKGLQADPEFDKLLKEFSRKAG